MGTNYYLTPKGFDEIEEINKITLKALNEIRDSYCKNIEELIEKSSKNHNIYKEVLELPDLDSIKCILQWDIEIPEIHLCKISAGWCPLLEATDYYNNFDDFKKFYEKYKDDFDITDEYNKHITIDEFESILTKAQQKAIEFHEKYNSNFYENSIKYTTDDYGFEWTYNHFC